MFKFLIGVLFGNMVLNIGLDVLFKLPKKRLKNDLNYFVTISMVIVIIMLLTVFNNNQIANIIVTNNIYAFIVLLFKVMNFIDGLLLLTLSVLTFRKTGRIVMTHDKQLTLN